MCFNNGTQQAQTLSYTQKKGEMMTKYKKIAASSAVGWVQKKDMLLLLK